MTRPLPRLKRRVEFLRVAGTRRKWVAPGLILQIRPHGPNERVPGGNPPIRVGFTTSKKVGNAVARNRARRRLRAVADVVISEQAQNGFDFVVIGRQATITRPHALLIKDMETALKKLGARQEARSGAEGSATGTKKQEARSGAEGFATGTKAQNTEIPS